MCFSWQRSQRYVRMSSPDMVLLSVILISLPHLGHVVREAREACLRRNQAGHFIPCSPGDFQFEHFSSQTLGWPFAMTMPSEIYALPSLPWDASVRTWPFCLTMITSKTSPLVAP